MYVKSHKTIVKCNPLSTTTVTMTMNSSNREWRSFWNGTDHIISTNPMCKHITPNGMWMRACARTVHTEIDPTNCFIFRISFTVPQFLCFYFRFVSSHLSPKMWYVISGTTNICKSIQRYFILVLWNFSVCLWIFSLFALYACLSVSKYTHTYTLISLHPKPNTFYDKSIGINVNDDGMNLVPYLVRCVSSMRMN